MNANSREMCGMDDGKKVTEESSSLEWKRTSKQNLSHAKSIPLHECNETPSWFIVSRLISDAHCIHAFQSHATRLNFTKGKYNTSYNSMAEMYISHFSHADSCSGRKMRSGLELPMFIIRVRENFVFCEIRCTMDFRWSFGLNNKSPWIIASDRITPNNSDTVSQLWERKTDDLCGNIASFWKLSIKGWKRLQKIMVSNHVRPSVVVVFS